MTAEPGGLGAPRNAGASQRFGVRLAVITAVGAVWRLGYLFAVKVDDQLLLNDSLYYSIQAGRNSEGDWFREALTELTGNFLPVTGAAFWSDKLGEARQTAELVAVNHERAQIMAPHTFVDPWADVRGTGEPAPDAAVKEAPWPSTDVPPPTEPTGW